MSFLLFIVFSCKEVDKKRMVLVDVFINQKESEFLVLSDNTFLNML